MMALLSAAACAASCAGAAAQARPAAAALAARTRLPGSAASVLAGPADALAAGVARDLLSFAPVVVVASAASPAGLAAAAARAEHAHAPLLLTTSPAGAPPGPGREGVPEPAVSAVTRAEITALHPRAVLAAGVSAAALSAQLPGTQVVADPAGLPRTAAPPGLRQVIMLVHQGGPAAATMAAVTTAQLAGVQVVVMPGYDPRADPAAIAALCAARPRQVLGLGAGFGPAGRLAARLAVTVTGVQLPGGGQVLFPLHRLVALYGHPGAPSLGALGQQGLRASIRRVREAAAPYRPLSRVPVVPTFEIIASVAQGSPGPDGRYSYESSAASLRPWVRRAAAAGLYVVLDLQPGRASLLAQARRYRSLLRLPGVGLALDPEWKLQPGQLPLRQIGGVGIAEVNSVINWLAGFTARYHLPQKLVVLHQFELSMIRGERWLSTRHDDLAIVIHMDGQGTPADKEQTWDAVTTAAPPGVFFGWKDFYRKDHPMLSPVQTMRRTPQPVMISYQ